MAGGPKNYAITDVIQGAGEVWVIGNPPSDSAQRLTLASDGSPDATAHPGSVHLGAIQSAITTGVKPKIAPIKLDQYDAPFDGYVESLDASIAADMAQTGSSLLQRYLGVGVFASGSGYEQTTFGGVYTVPKACIAVISPTRQNPLQFVVSLLYSAYASGGFQVEMGKAKPAMSKIKFEGLTDFVVSRTAGQAVGLVYQTLVNASGGTPTARGYNVAQIFQGPADFWLVDINAGSGSSTPTDAAPRVTLDPATLTPDLATHPNAVDLGMSAGPVNFSVVPKIETIKADQFDSGVDAWVAEITAKLEGEMIESSMDKLARALGVGNYSISAGVYAQATFGGTFQPPKFAVCAIGKKRTAPTKAAVCCLYTVNPTGGVSWIASRQKMSTYKLTFDGLMDPLRTPGRQMGIFHEMV